MPRCYIFDIDGTLADLSHRLHHIQKQPKDWDAFFRECGSDAPIEHICELARLLNDADQHIVLVSGRSEGYRKETKHWLDRHEISYHGIYMRQDGDHRPDHIVKSELMDRVRADGFEPVMIFEDREQVVKMWRERGIPCAQVAEGNF